MPDLLRIFRSVLPCVLLVLLAGCDDFRNTPAKLKPAEKTPVNPGPVDDDAPTEFTTTASGLKYRIRRKSEGKKPAASDTVEVHYRGWLDDNSEFDSSYKRGETATFPLKGVVPGWTEGLQLVGEGGMIELEVPYQLGYGERGNAPAIPPKARLHFLVELLRIKR